MRRREASHGGKNDLRHYPTHFVDQHNSVRSHLFLPLSLSSSLPFHSLLILNAGVAEKEHPNVNASQLEHKELMDMFEVNVCGTASVIKHMLPLVLESHEKKVIGVTTNMASLEEATADKPYISAGYRITKAAENMRE